MTVYNLKPAKGKFADPPRLKSAASDKRLIGSAEYFKHRQDVISLEKETQRWVATKNLIKIHKYLIKHFKWIVGLGFVREVDSFEFENELPIDSNSKLVLVFESLKGLRFSVIIGKDDVLFTEFKIENSTGDANMIQSKLSEIASMKRISAFDPETGKSYGIALDKYKEYLGQDRSGIMKSFNDPSAEIITLKERESLSKDKFFGDLMELSAKWKDHMNTRKAPAGKGGIKLTPNRSEAFRYYADVKLGDDFFHVTCKEKKFKHGANKGILHFDEITAPSNDPLQEKTIEAYLKLLRSDFSGICKKIATLQIRQGNLESLGALKFNYRNPVFQKGKKTGKCKILDIKKGEQT